ncbi:MAG: phenylacetate-CoA oxygenase subunit PaaJ [Candidatus Dormibacteraeota bacterium]|nr:phenylacetate-CoA oxygenase subunit PaaJ [Candidatus Dormibacteraeota bacterium]
MVTVAAEDLRRAIGEVPDPEIPVLTIHDLGILRDVRVDAAGHVDVDITPTYSGCPALEAIREDVERRVRGLGYDVTVHTVLSPAWTTDWLSDEARAKLHDHGVAPPRHRDASLRLIEVQVTCPVCESVHTDEIAHFASTPCQALRRCQECREPFQHFKEH